MTLTTKTSATTPVVGAVTPTPGSDGKSPVAAVTSATAPPTPPQHYGNTPPEKVFTTSEAKLPPIVARRLVLPDFIDVKPKNPNITLYWANFKATDGQRAQKLEYQGFEYATIEDIAPGKDGKPGINPRYLKNGRIINGDVILMKIPREQYEGALLYNHNEAIRRGGRTGLPKNYVADAASEIQGRADSKITFFKPGKSDMAGIDGMEEVTVK